MTILVLEFFVLKIEKKRFRSTVITFLKFNTDVSLTSINIRSSFSEFGNTTRVLDDVYDTELVSRFLLRADPLLVDSILPVPTHVQKHGRSHSKFCVFFHALY